ncbi:MAG: STAS domain-containing protein [Myxococcaceae bacterium]|nr:STAS domain-containing protein [Myxococcaceae bacterium]
MEQPAGQIWVGTLEQTVCVRVQGRATHLHGQPLRDVAREMLSRGFRRVELDLGKCTYMDSTFLGVLVGISMRLEKMGADKVAIFRISPRNLELFKTLGVDRFFQMDSPGAMAHADDLNDARALVEARQATPAWATTIIEAHQLLVESDDRNEPRFKELLAFLKEDLARKETAMPGPSNDEGARRWKH